ncbi:MAG: hypothetical protein JRJ87_05000 [Deltaproteobacteria bacterium]|nr:hypothetical protein [Deltaproteobacteria bacterium]
MRPVSIFSVVILLLAAQSGHASETPAAIKKFELTLDFTMAVEACRELAGTQPDNPASVDVLTRMVRLASALGQPEQIVWAVSVLWQLKKEELNAFRWTLTVAKFYENAGDNTKASRLYRELLNKHVFKIPQSDRLSARLGLGRAKLNDNLFIQAREQLVRVVGQYQKAKPTEQPALSGSAAEAAYWLAKMRLAEIDWANPGLQDIEALKRLLKHKIKGLRTADKNLQEVFKYKQPLWSSAAAVEYGRLYRRFADWLLSLPRPKHFSNEELDIYVQALEDMTYPFYEKACQAFNNVIRLVAGSHLGAKYGRLARSELFEMGDSCRDRIYPWFLMKVRHWLDILPADEARKVLQLMKELLKANPDKAEYRLQAAEAYLALAKPEQADHVLSWLVPASEKRTLLLVRTALALDKTALASGLVSDLLKFNPANLAALRVQAWLKLQLGDLAGAQKDLQQIIKSEPTRAIWPLSLGVVYFGRGLLKKAEEQFGNVLKLNPTFKEVRFNLGILYYYGYAARAKEKSGIMGARQRLENLQNAVKHFDAYRPSPGTKEAEDLEIIDTARQELAGFKKAMRELSDLKKLQEQPDND